ncbi:MAG: metallophosphoesterase [Firmicutes bacterium]|nr:metallophosphoesterase [Bacillota bacterium]MBQ3964027.1 metallophosphoesterase [Bacillota bacterium]
MRIFIVGDLHLSNDKTIEKPMDVFGLSWKDHDLRIREDWDAVVGDEDLVIVAGDISWGLKLEEAMADLEWIHARPGRKVLIKGNHDLWWNGITKLNQLYNDIFFLQNSCYETENCIICGTRGWVCPGSEGFTDQDRKIYLRESQRLKASLDAACAGNDKEIIGVLHYPPTNDKMQPSAFTELFETYGVKKVFYGHLHGQEAFKKGLKGNLNGVCYDLVSLDYLQCRLKEIR